MPKAANRELPFRPKLIELPFSRQERTLSWRLIGRHAGFFNYDPESRAYCIITVPAPWRDTPGPTWQLVAAMLRNQRRLFSGTASETSSGAPQLLESNFAARTVGACSGSVFIKHIVVI
jgi:hypothetical protein